MAVSERVRRSQVPCILVSNDSALSALDPYQCRNNGNTLQLSRTLISLGIEQWPMALLFIESATIHSTEKLNLIGDGKSLHKISLQGSDNRSQIKDKWYTTIRNRRNIWSCTMIPLPSPFQQKQLGTILSFISDICYAY